MKNLKISYPYSWVGHIPFAFYLMDRFCPGNLVELGTHSGNSFLAFCLASKQNDFKSELFAVDTWQGDFQAGYYDESIFLELKNYIEGKNYRNVNLIKKEFNVAVNDFLEKSIDCLHIDGLHTYEAVKNDFNTWLPKLKEDSLILFHDTAVDSSDFGVKKFWNELIHEFPFNINFTHSYGLGVLSISKNVESRSAKFIIELKENLGLINLLTSAGNQLLELQKSRNELEKMKSDYSKILNSKPIKIRNYLRRILNSIK